MVNEPSVFEPLKFYFYTVYTQSLHLFTFQHLISQTTDVSNYFIYFYAPATKWERRIDLSLFSLFFEGEILGDGVGAETRIFT